MEDRKRGRTNLRADVTPLVEGMVLSAVNTFGGLRRDRARLLDWFGRFLPVGFYYKTFYKPRRLVPVLRASDARDGRPGRDRPQTAAGVHAQGV